jgi:hypothetical protein
VLCVAVSDAPAAGALERLIPGAGVVVSDFTGVDAVSDFCDFHVGVAVGAADRLGEVLGAAVVSGGSALSAVHGGLP